MAPSKSLLRLQIKRVLMFEFQTLSSQIQHQGAVRTLNYCAVLWYGEDKETENGHYDIYFQSLAVLY